MVKNAGWGSASAQVNEQQTYTHANYWGGINIARIASAVVACTYVCHVYLKIMTDWMDETSKATDVFRVKLLCSDLCHQKQINKLNPELCIRRWRQQRREKCIAESESVMVMVVAVAGSQCKWDREHAMWTYYLLKFEFIGVSMKNRLAHTIADETNPENSSSSSSSSSTSLLDAELDCIEIHAFRATFKAHYTANGVCMAYAT